MQRFILAVLLALSIVHPAFAQDGQDGENGESNQHENDDADHDGG
jgi:hypothetical protein